MDSQARVRALYGVMQSIENKLGGGEGVEGLYGSINKGGMQKIIAALNSKCGLDGSSRLVDIGAGLGRPLMHALIEPGIASAFGVEIDRIKCDKAVAFLQQTALELQRRGACPEKLDVPAIQCSSIEQIKTLDPCTHAYSFWEGVPYDGKMAFGRLFAGSRTLRSVAVVQRAMRGKQEPAEVMEELGFGSLALVDSFSVSMSGSGRSFTAYVFNRVDNPAQLSIPVAAEQAAADSVATPTLSQEPQLVCQADSDHPTVQQPTDVADTAAATAAAPCAADLEAGDAAVPREQPAMGRGAMRAVRSVKAAAVEAAAAEAAATQRGRPSRRAAAGKAAAADTPQQQSAAAAQADTAGPQAGAKGARKAASPQKLKGVQKKQSPKKQVNVLHDARVRRPRVPAAVGGKAATRGEEVPAEEAVHRPARRGLLA